MEIIYLYQKYNSTVLPPHPLQSLYKYNVHTRNAQASSGYILNDTYKCYCWIRMDKLLTL